MPLDVSMRAIRLKSRQPIVTCSFSRQGPYPYEVAISTVI